jgi:hypothetical protein
MTPSPTVNTAPDKGVVVVVGAGTGARAVVGAVAGAETTGAGRAETGGALVGAAPERTPAEPQAVSAATSSTAPMTLDRLLIR